MGARTIGATRATATGKLLILIALAWLAGGEFIVGLFVRDSQSSWVARAARDLDTTFRDEAVVWEEEPPTLVERAVPRAVDTAARRTPVGEIAVVPRCDAAIPVP